jgi:hypothetical protein
VQAVGRGDREKPDLPDVFSDRLMRGERLGCHGTAIGDREFRAGIGLAQPIAAGDDRLGEIRVHRPLGLLDRSCRQPEIDRFPGLALDLLKGPAQQDREFVGIGRLKLASPGWASPVSGSPTDWCAPSSGARVIPEGVATRMKRASW